MKNLFQLIENGTIVLNDGYHCVDGVHIMFINGFPYKEVICKNDEGDVLFKTNNIDMYGKNHYRFEYLKNDIKFYKSYDKCKYTYNTYNTDIKNVTLYYKVYLEFIPFMAHQIDESDKIKGEELFSKLDRILHDIVDSHNIDNWNDRQNDDDDDEWI